MKVRQSVPQPYGCFSREGLQVRIERSQLAHQHMTSWKLTRISGQGCERQLVRKTK